LLYINSPLEDYQLEVFRMGWYGGLGARSVFGPFSFTKYGQPQCTKAPDTALIECQWNQPYMLSTSAFRSQVSGYYLVKLTSASYDSYIIFVVRDDNRTPKFLMNSAISTYQAYNQYGGNSLYTTYTDGGSQNLVSYDRPYAYNKGAGDF